MMHNIRGLGPATLADLALLQQRLAYLSMQVTGEGFVPQFLFSPYAQQRLPHPASDSSMTHQPSAMPPIGSFPQVASGALPPYLPYGLAYPPMSSSQVLSGVTSTAAVVSSQADVPQPSSPTGSQPCDVLPRSVQSPVSTETPLGVHPAASQSATSQGYQPHSMHNYPPATIPPGIPEVPSSPSSPRKQLPGAATAAVQDPNAGAQKGAVCPAAMSDEASKQRKPPAAINLENLDQELRKLHSQGNVAMLRRDSMMPATILTPAHSQAQVIPCAQVGHLPAVAATVPPLSPSVVDSVALGLADVPMSPPPMGATAAADIGATTAAPTTPQRRLSRFRVSAVTDDPLRALDVTPADVKPETERERKVAATISGLPSHAMLDAGAVEVSSAVSDATETLVHPPFRKSTRSFSVPSPHGGNHIPSARVTPLLQVTSPQFTVEGSPATSATTTTTATATATTVTLETTAVKSVAPQQPPTSQTLEIQSSSLEAALAQIMKGAFSNLAAVMQNAVEQSGGGALIGASPETKSTPSSPGAKSRSLEAPSPAKKTMTRDAGVQTDRLSTKSIAINTPRPAPRGGPVQHLTVGGATNLQKTKSETMLNQLGLPLKVSPARRPTTLTVAGQQLYPTSGMQRGMSLQVPTDVAHLAAESATRLNRYPSMADLTNVGLDGSNASCSLAVPGGSGLSRAKSCVDVSQLGRSAPSPPIGGGGGWPPNGGASGGLEAPRGYGQSLSVDGHHPSLQVNGSNLSRARSLLDVSRTRTASAGDVPVSHLTQQRRGSALHDDHGADRPASISDVSQLGFHPRNIKRAVDLGRSVPFTQFLSSLAHEQRRSSQDSTCHERSASEEEMFTDEFFRYIIARQQKERDELEWRHRLELDNFRRRRKHPYQSMTGLPDEAQAAFTVGSFPVSGVWSSPPRSPVLPPTNGFGSSKAPPPSSLSRGAAPTAMSSIPNSPVTSQSPLTFGAVTVQSGSSTCPIRPSMARSFSDCPTSHLPSSGKAKTLTDDLLRMIGDLGAASKMSGGRGAGGDASAAEPKLTLNQMKNRRQMSSDESSPSPQLSPSSLHRGASLGPQSPPSPSASNATAAVPPPPTSSAAAAAAAAASSASIPSSWPQPIPQLHHQGYRVAGAPPHHHHPHAANHQRIPTSLQYAPPAPSTTPPMQPQWLHQLPAHVYPKQGASWGGLPQGVSMATYLQMMQQQYFCSQPSVVAASQSAQPPTTLSLQSASSSHNNGSGGSNNHLGSASSNHP